MPRLKTWRLLAALLALVLLVAGCGSDDDEGGEDTGTGGTTPSGEAVEAPDTLTIAYQNIPNGDLIVKEQGLLEAALPDTEIEWKLFDSGGAVNEAFIAGDIDIGLAGSSPVSRGLSGDIPYKVVWIHDVIGAAESLVVKPEITSLEDLAGKTIATPFASTAHYSLLAALEDAGVDPTTVDIIDSEPDDIYAAWTGGDIDGAYVWNPNLAKIVDEGGEVLVTSAELAEKGKTTYDLGVVSDELAEQYPDVVRAWVAAQDQAVQILNEAPDDAAAIIAGALEIEPADAAAQIEDLIYVSAADQAGADHFGGVLQENIIATAAFNQEQGEIEAVLEDAAYEADVDGQFLTS